MIDNYINKRHQIMKKNREKDNYIFGLFFGFILLLLNIYIFLSTPDIKILNYVNVILMMVGCIFILVATIYPNALDLIHKFLNKLFSIIGNLFFKLILTIIYFALVLPIGLIIKSKEKKVNKEETNFVDYKSNNNLESNKKGFYNIFLIFKLFNNERYALMIPLIIVLIIIGFLLIFVQSSVVAPFIYTLF